MSSELIFLVEEDPESGYTARSLGEAIFTQGDTLDELRTNIKEAVQCHFDKAAQPKLIRLHFVKEELMAV